VTAIINYNYMTKPAKHCIDMSNDWYIKHGVTRGNNNEFDLQNMLHGDILFVKTDFVFNGTFVNKCLKHIDKKFILVTGVSSYSIDEGDPSYKQILNSPYLIKWFCTNPPTKRHPKIEWLPIGFEEPERKGGNIEILNDFYNIKHDWNDKKDKIYIPFHGNTFNTRSEIIDLVSKNDFVEVESNRLEFSEYLLKLSNYKYVLSLRGAGWDCHRHYECLLVNSVPIMDGGPIMRNFALNNIPVMDISDINKTIFDKTWDFTASKQLLQTEYHTDKILKCQKDFYDFPFTIDEK